MTNEKPILFSAPMVQAILEGRKTQTRRAIKSLEYFGGLGDENDPSCYGRAYVNGYSFLVNETQDPNNNQIPCPYGQIGDELWVRETWQGFRQTNYEYDEWEEMESPKDRHEYIYTPVYRADGKNHPEKWQPSIFMPREYSRIQLSITDVRVERLNDISDDDAMWEGADVWAENPDNRPVSPNGCIDKYNNCKQAFEALWESINGAGSWDQNPWVWVVDFERVKP